MFFENSKKKRKHFGFADVLFFVVKGLAGGNVRMSLKKIKMSSELKGFPGNDYILFILVIYVLIFINTFSIIATH